MAGEGERWIRFLRQYGPIPRNDNMFDEHIRRSAGRLGVVPITFRHPLEDKVLVPFTTANDGARVVVLTGTADDGKSYLCGRVWQALGGTTAEWASDNRGGRLGLNSVSVPIDGLPTDPFHRLPLRGVAQGGRSPTEAMLRNGGEIHAASATARPAK